MAERQISLVKTAFMRMWSLSNVPMIFLAQAECGRTQF